MSEGQPTPNRKPNTFALVALVGPLMAVVACGTLRSGGSPQTRTAPPRATISQATPATMAPEAAIKRDITSGQPIVLLFMGPGCTTCADAANALTSAAGTLNQASGGAQGVMLVGVDMASSDSLADLQSFVEATQLGALPITWTVDADGSLTAQYQVISLTETVGIVNGRVHFHNPGGDTDAAQFRQQMKEML